MRGCGQLKLLECLEPALHLARLRRLGAKAFDETNDLFGFARLTSCQRLLAREILAALALEGGVVATVDGRASLLEMHRVIGDGIEEIPVVSDHQQCALEAPQMPFEPQHRVEIE